MDIPERKHILVIKIGADTWESILGAIRDIEYVLHRDGPGRQLVSGGSSHGYIVIDKINPDQTNDAYFEAIDKWLEIEKNKGELVGEQNDTNNE